MRAGESNAATSGQERAYRCYLIRCRREQCAGEGKLRGEPTASPAGWRFTVEQVRPDAARRSFTSIQDVAAYIDAELARCDTLARGEGIAARGAQQDSNLSTYSEVEP